MTEKTLTVEWYVSRMRDAILNKTSKEVFFGSVSFEINIKSGAITNMNVVSKESLIKE